MLRVGLTGSIAVGKSFVSAILSELGCHVLDADATAREVVIPGSQGLKQIVESFGVSVLDSDGTLNRTKLGQLVFESEDRRKLLNSILHPLIIAEQDKVLREWEASDPEGIGVVDAALMIESGGYRRFDKLIVVHCKPEVQLHRLIERGGLTREEAEARIASQMPQEEKIRFADFLIDTSGDKIESRRQTEEVYQVLCEIVDRDRVEPRE
jgi:dephospho-CoA kinase